MTIRQVPRIDILDEIPHNCLQMLSLSLMIWTLVSLTRERSLPTYQRNFKAFCVVFNPLTLHYLCYWPQTSLLMFLTAMVCFPNTNCRWIMVSSLLVLRPEYFALLSSLSQKSFKRAISLYLTILTLFYCLCRANFVSPFDQKYYPVSPPNSQPSINFIWILQSHMFNKYQSLYDVFYSCVPILSVVPLWGLKLPSVMASNVAILLGIYILDYCPLGWHYVLSFSLWINYWTQKWKFRQQDQNLMKIINTIKQRQQSESKTESFQFTEPYRQKLWFLFGVISATGGALYACCLYFIISKWGRSYQLNTGYILMYNIVVWLLHAVCTIQLVNLSLSKDQQEWNQYAHTLIVKNNQKPIFRVINFLGQRWSEM